MITILPLEINGWKAPMHSTYVFERKKVYLIEPSRSLSGQMNFSDKIFVPYFTVSWAHMTIDNFTKLMALTENDETLVTYYDTFSNAYATAKFAVQQPAYEKLYAMKSDRDGVLGLKLVFDGTLNDIAKITVEYNKNNANASGTLPPSITGWMGQEFRTSEAKSLTASAQKVESWNAVADGSGTKYILGGTLALASNMTLYAQWIPNTKFVLSYDYSVGTIEKNADNSPKTSKECIYNEAIGALPTTAPKTITYDGKIITEPYTLQGWYALTNGDGSQFTANSLYNVQANITIHAYFKPQDFTLTFNSNGGNYTPSTLTQAYKSSIYAPYAPTKSGYKFLGWFKDVSLTKYFSFGTMPPENITLYAKWEVVAV
ncbi:MAG: InlB B-repeat-containing protein [Clostridia bacterium]